jgi:hypothetical protein
MVAQQGMMASPPARFVMLSKAKHLWRLPSVTGEKMIRDSSRRSE